MVERGMRSCGVTVSAGIGRGAMALTVFVLSSTWSPVPAQIIERVLAVVDGRVITLLDVEAARSLGLVEASGGGDQTQAALAQLIDRALILDEVDRYAPPEPDPAAVEQGLASIRRRFASGAAYDQALARTGMEPFAVRQWVRNDLRIQAYLDERFAAAAEAGATVAPSLSAPVGDRERRDALVRQWVEALRGRARISRP